MIPNLTSYLDLANHHADATHEDIENICAKVIQYGFNAAFLNPCYIQTARDYCTKQHAQVKVGTVISFPLGQDTVDIKIQSAIACVRLGADELDIVPNNGLLISNEHDMYLSELTQIVTAVRGLEKLTIVKFILETGYFYPKYAADSTDALQAKGDELVRAGAGMIKKSGADFVKICSGMGPRGASLDDVRLVREVVGETMKIKVAGGIDTLAEAESFISAGVHRIGSSKAVEIVKEQI